MSEERSRKRRRLSNDDDTHKNQKTLPNSLTSSISPPPLRRTQKPEDSGPELLKSPFQLTWIRDLPEASNKDTVSLKDLLSDPLISECWEFNYLHDLDFLMDAFDPDVRDLVRVHVVHGFWKTEDSSRLNLKAQAENHPNITLHTAYMPEMFGTHHTKMLVLLRHDNTAQIIIHTANMIAFDWTNMAQAAWISPMLPLLSATGLSEVKPGPLGSGSRFKVDFLNYLKAYDNNPKRQICKQLVETLAKHDFSEIRGALVGSVPGKHHIEKESETRWGWEALQNVLRGVPVKSNDAEIVIQISSIATLSEKWIEKTLFQAMSTSRNFPKSKSKFKVIFPTADEIRRSLNGYDSGSAIHTKIQSAAQAKQVQYLKPIFCHWAGDGEDHVSGSESTSDAGRKRAAPHVKTFIRFADAKKTTIEWMLVTSANLSKQAWGEALNAGGDVRICSYELGVMVWPELYGEKATMIPTFKTDMPSPNSGKAGEVVVGARMSYDLPLVPYGKGDMPWCATLSYKEPDWKGNSYNVQ